MFQKARYNNRMSSPKYPYIHADIDLDSPDGNSFVILGNIAGAMRCAQVPEEEIAEFQDQATADNYDHLLATCAAWVHFPAAEEWVRERAYERQASEDAAAAPG